MRGTSSIGALSGGTPLTLKFSAKRRLLNPVVGSFSLGHATVPSDLYHPKICHVRPYYVRLQYVCTAHDIGVPDCDLVPSKLLPAMHAYKQCVKNPFLAHTYPTLLD